MTEEAHKLIIDREKAISWAEENLNPQIQLLNEIVDYGSNLIMRLSDSPPNNLEDAIIKGVFLKQIVSMLDSVGILLEQGASHAAYLSGRSAFEASIYLEWMLYSDSAKKAKYYYVENLRQKKSFLQKTISTHPDFKEYSKSMLEMGWDITSSQFDFDTESAKQINTINQVLSKAKYKSINRDFDKKRKHKMDKHWYQMLGYRSIRSLAKSLGRVGEYEAFYRKGSKVHHSSSYFDHIRFGKNSASLIPIRHFENATELLNWTISIVLSSYRKVLLYYRPGEFDNFRKIYIEEWRTEFRSIPNIKINWEVMSKP